MDVKELLCNVITSTVPYMPEAQVNSTVDHLMGPLVGVVHPSLLHLVTEEDLMPLGTVLRRAVLAGIKRHVQGDVVINDRQDVGLTGHPQNVIADSDVNESRSGFTFKICWDELSLRILLRLDLAERNKQAAHPILQLKFKKAIVQKCWKAYKAHKERHPCKFKTPGVKVYRDIAAQLTEKYKYAFQVQENGNQIDDGTDTFFRAFKISMENKFRSKPQEARIPSAQKGRGLVGVNPSQYCPTLNAQEEVEEELIKLSLQAIWLTKRRSEWDLTEITKFMHSSYALQRKEIVAFIEKVKTKECGNELLPDPNDPLGDHEDGLKKLLEDWPFLTDLRWQSVHFQQLKGHLLELPFDSFVENQLNNLILYLSTSEAKELFTKNLSLKLKWERHGKNESTKMLLAVMMVANYFKEDFHALVKTAEKTTEPSEVKALLQNGSLCVIALDHSILLAEKFYLVLDQQVIMECSTFNEALVGFFQSAFMFDVEYPKELQYTSEYLERVVFGLGCFDSQVRQREVIVITPSVLRLVNNLRGFAEDLSSEMAQ